MGRIRVENVGSGSQVRREHHNPLILPIVVELPCISLADIGAGAVVVSPFCCGFVAVALSPPFVAVAFRACPRRQVYGECGAGIIPGKIVYCCTMKCAPAQLNAPPVCNPN